MKMEKPNDLLDEHLVYLDKLRESGITNMFGAGIYLENAFNIDKSTAREILTYWMETFSQRQSK